MCWERELILLVYLVFCAWIMLKVCGWEGPKWRGTAKNAATAEQNLEY